MLLLLPFGSERGLANEKSWTQTVAQVADSVVSLELSRLRAFGDDGQGISTATGFVVDSERGLIVTNRHVLGIGPVSGNATFQNQERVTLVPVYRDPVHDFGILRYDPNALQFMQPKALSLRPDKAKRGLDIRVIGSDGGEQLSILAGTIARLDRAAPNYGRYSYNDFNTFYLQAASGTSGGSSGSPVVDIDGDVVALNAGANSSTASSFFLPLNPIVQALNSIRLGQEVPRGTLQTVFRYQPYRVLQRLGLSDAVAKRTRLARPSAKGLLVVGQVFKDGVSDGKLLEGDILMGLNDDAVYDFYDLERFLNHHVGDTVEVQVWRQDAKKLLDIRVNDLQALVPQRLLEFGGGVLHDMSYQQARGMHLPQQGVAVANPGYVLQRANIERQAIITAVNGEPVRRLDDLVRHIEKGQDGDNWRLRFVMPRREYTEELARLEVDTEWFDSRLCERRDNLARWDCRALTPKKAAQSKQTVQALTAVAGSAFSDPKLQTVADYLVQIDFDIPHPTDNVYARNFRGTGLLVSPKEGLVAVDRNTVPVALGEAQVTLFGSEKVPAQVVFVHPRHNLALLKFDPKYLAGMQLKAPALSRDTRLKSHLSHLIGYGLDGALVLQDIDQVLDATLNFSPPSLPRFQQSPIEVYSVPNARSTLGGVLMDDKETIQALWASFSFQDGKNISEGEWGLPANIIVEALELYRQEVALYDMGALFGYLSLSEARSLGLPDEWLKKLQQRVGEKRRVLYLYQLNKGALSAASLKVGDILLAVDGEPLNRIRALELALSSPSVNLTLLRNGKVKGVSVELQPLNGQGTGHMLYWAGAYLQMPHPEVVRLGDGKVKGVYVGYVDSGAPAMRDGLYRNRFITEVDGVPVTSLEQFLQRVSGVKSGDNIRITTVLLSGRKRLVGVKPEYDFWPTQRFIRREGKWHRVVE